jgi:excinuclease UvrABC helicase subunit UvrB
MFSNLFNYEFIPSSTKYNWDTLKTMGKVTEDKVTDKETGLTTITRTFESTGGLMTITSAESYYESTKRDEQYYELKSKLDKAVEEQRYEDAIKYRDEITAIKKEMKLKKNDKKN